MRTFSRFLVITSLVAALSGCLGSGVPDTGQRAQAIHEVAADSLPHDIMSCDDFYGNDWDIPDLIMIVSDRTGLVVLVQEDEMVCTGQISQLELRLRDAGAGAAPGSGPGQLIQLEGENELPAGGSEDGLGDRGADIPVGDSNPLPASPCGDDATDSPVGDSNPLPAQPVVDESGTVEDSNPLPAHSADQASHGITTH